MTREDVLRRLAAEGFSDTVYHSFGGDLYECRACRKMVIRRGESSSHVTWHRKQSRKYPSEFWANTRFIHHMLVLPTDPEDRVVNGVAFSRICNFLTDAGLSPPGNNGLASLVWWTMEFFGNHRRRLREAGFNIRNRHPRQDYFLVDEAAFVFIFDLIKSGMDADEILAVVENVKHTRRTEAA